MSELTELRQRFVENMSRISEFWGYPRVMGSLYGALYLSPGPLSLDELVEIAGVTKGAVSTNIRGLEQLGMVHKQVRIGERKDYYVAEIDFWSISKRMLERRQKPEFDKALGDVGLLLKQVKARSRARGEAELAAFYEVRLRDMESFFRTLDGIVATLLQVEKLRVEGLTALLPGRTKKRQEP